MAVEGTAPTSDRLGAAINTIAGFAQFNGPERPAHVRIAGYEDAIYLDLCDELWRVVEVIRHG